MSSKRNKKIIMLDTGLRDTDSCGVTSSQTNHYNILFPIARSVHIIQLHRSTFNMSMGSLYSLDVFRDLENGLIVFSGYNETVKAATVSDTVYIFKPSNDISIVAITMQEPGINKYHWVSIEEAVR